MMQIQRSFKSSSKTGTLYLVPTPIGNLADMTKRAIAILQAVDMICSEDTRTTGVLLKHYQIATKQMSFHEHNAYEKIPYVISRLKAGFSLAQVSDAGMPSISDPGHDLVKAAIQEQIPVVALPGPSAGITALIASGLLPQPHIFYGFLPRKKQAQEAFLKSKAHYPETQIFYESPYRLLATLKMIRSVYGERQLVLAREVTKQYEEYQRGFISEVIATLEEKSVKGECILLLEGYTEALDTTQAEDPFLLIDALIEQGEKPNQAIKQVARKQGLNRKELYQGYHDLKSDC